MLQISHLLFAKLYHLTARKIANQHFLIIMFVLHKATYLAY